MPVADYLAAYEDEMEGLRAYDRALFGGSPEEVHDVYVRSSPITYVDAVAAPVLVVAGANDPRCPIRQIDNYLAELESWARSTRSTGSTPATARWSSRRPSARSRSRWTSRYAT